jgi:hypothetical protein
MIFTNHFPNENLKQIISHDDDHGMNQIIDVTKEVNFLPLRHKDTKYKSDIFVYQYFFVP